MNKSAKILIVVIVILAVGAVLVIKQRETGASETAIAPGATAAGMNNAAKPVPSALPRLIELGSISCIPCKMMAPILEELRKEYAGKLQVEFIDVKEDPDASMFYGIRVIPTQVFLDAEGVELFRHEGFFPKEEILAQWKALGVNLQTDIQ
jgi:thioredoxin 1